VVIPVGTLTRQWLPPGQQVNPAIELFGDMDDYNETLYERDLYRRAVVSQPNSQDNMKFISQPQGTPYTGMADYTFDNSFMGTGQIMYSLDYGVLQGTEVSFI